MLGKATRSSYNGTHTPLPLFYMQLLCETCILSLHFIKRKGKKKKNAVEAEDIAKLLKMVLQEINVGKVCCLKFPRLYETRVTHLERLIIIVLYLTGRKCNGGLCLSVYLSGRPSH